MLPSLTAVGAALVSSIRYQYNLQIKLKECPRYWLKSINLALCYRGFIPNKSLKASRNAGRAAFYCCAYDVITDWQDYNENGYQWFRRLLTKDVPEHLASIAFRLYEQERSGGLHFDGLSRGIDALEFVSGLIGSATFIRQNTNLQYLGVVMQIVDDVLDFEEDQRNAELNCLLITVEQRRKHLHTLLTFDLDAFRNLFPHARVLCRVIQIAQEKAKKMTLDERMFLKELPGVFGSPNQDVTNKEQAEIAGYVGN